LSRQLYINERLIDLFPDEEIRLSYQVNNIAELANRQANFSNAFDLPDTNNNRAALGFANRIESNTNIPYRKSQMTYIQNGVPVFPSGVAICEEYSGRFRVVLYSGIFDFFTQLGELSLKDIDWSEYNHTYDVSTVITINQEYLEGTSDVCMPLIQYGGYDNPAVDIKYQCFSLRYSAIMDKIFEKTTYTVTGEIFNHGIYLDQALTLNPDQQEPNPDDLEARSLQVTAPGGLSDAGIPITTGPNISNIMGLFTVDYDPSDNLIRDTINPSTISYPATWIPEQTLNETRYRATYFGTVEIETKLLFSSMRLNGVENYRIFKNNVLVHIAQIGNYPEQSGDVLTLEFENLYTLDVKPGDEIKVQFYAIHWTIDNTSVSLNYVKIENISTIPLGQEVNYNYLVPDIKLKDFVRSFCQEFGLIVTSTGSTVEFSQFAEIKDNISNAEDWSDKLDTSITPTIQYRLGNYAQVNNFKWKADDQTKGFGDSSFTINDQTLDLNYDLFEMIHPSSLPVENIRGISVKFLPLPLADYYDKPSWSPLVGYDVDDEVGYNSVIYVCIQSTVGVVNVPIDNPFYWEIRSDQYLTNQKNEGIQIPRFTKVEADDWDEEETYETDDLVSYGSVIYVAIATTIGNVPSAAGSVGFWQVRTLQYEQTISSESRLVLIRPIYRTYPGAPTPDTIVYTDGTTSIGTGTNGVPMAYFSDPLEPYNLTGQYLLSAYYPELINMLINLKLVECYIRLTDADISKLNFLTLKYIKHFGNYFYLNMVEDYVSNQSTKAQLIRM
jgi:hypothetical protein